MTTKLTNVIRCLERENTDGSITSIDIRGKLCSSENSKDRRQEVLQLTEAIQSYSSRLKVLSLHNNLLNRREMPDLINMVGDLHLLEKLVFFSHDVRYDLAGLLVDRLTGVRSKSNDILAKGTVDANETISSETIALVGLKELFLSHCNIGCEGAKKIANALVGTFSSTDDRHNRLKHLRVLSLGSNNIKKDGAFSLAKAFAQCPSLHRMVLHGNDLASTDTNEFIQYALAPNGWQQSLDGQQPHDVPMPIITQLIASHVTSRWKGDHVLIRPHELARQRLEEEMYKNHSTFVDERLEEMYGLLSWMGRIGMCSKPTSCQSQQGTRGSSTLSRCHSYGREECAGCKNIHLNDVYFLMRRMPHLAEWFRKPVK